MIRAACALALALLSTGCARKPVQARPALWRVADGDTTIWLLGSIHALPPGVRWRTPDVARAIVAADTLILEVPPGDPQAARAAFLAVARRAGLPPILDRVPARDRLPIARGIAAAGQSAATLDGFKTWAAALVIGADAARTRGAGAADAVEAVLTRAFAGRRIGALETDAGQLALFDRLPEASQRRLLADAARDAADPTRGYDALLAAWRHGDTRRLAATLAPLRADPAIAAPLIDRRNARWAGAIAARMVRPGRVLVAVGAGHLVGPGSVVALLRAHGLPVERVE